MKTKIFKVIYGRKEMPLIVTKLLARNDDEAKLLNECEIKENLILFDFLDQNRCREEDGFMFMLAKEFIGINFENLQSGQDIELGVVKE